MTTLFELHIEKLVHGGAGLGHYQGKAVFVHGTAPDDFVRVQETRGARDFIEAELIQILRPSQMRIEPACTLTEECGGCHWLHIQYPSQLQAKENIFQETLRRIGGIDDYHLDPSIPAEKPLGYRSRVRLQVRGRAGRRVVGFFRMRSADVVDVAHCASATAGVSHMLALLRGLLQAENHLPPIDEVEITAGEESGEGMLLFRTGVRVRAADALLLGEAALTLEGVKAVTIVSQGMHKNFGSLPVLYHLRVDDGHAIGYRISPLAFMQAHYAANRALVKSVVEYAAPDPSSIALDLFCGAGNFSVPLACKAGEVMASDLSVHAIRSARLNAGENRISNVRFSCEASHRTVERLLSQGRRPGVVALDPPRSGAKNVAEILPALSPRRIIYVSCDPATLARDLRILAAQGYRVERARVVDMFPQTSHIESVTLIVKG